jgi:hypothetical protein
MGRLRQIVRDLETRMDELEMESIDSIRGKLSLESHVEPAAFERSSYIKLLQSFHRI